ncbi:MAG: DEAD/DEAH box helicase [Opitutaceae bacterium]|nr:DEAD/DEAH box helicase [Opitutaceae bacterium]
MAPNLEFLLAWEPPRPVLTPRGRLLLRAAPAPPGLLALWQQHRDELAGQGYWLGRTRQGGLILRQFQPLPGGQNVDPCDLTDLSQAVDTDFEPPAPDGLAYYGYQKAGIDFAWTVRRGLIADEMGLGKTIEAIGLANVQHECETLQWMLVVTPACLKVNWRRELERWLTFPAEIATAKGRRPAAIADLFKTTDRPRILIINYELLWGWQRTLERVPWSLYVADEAHYLCHPRAQRSQVGLRITAPRQVFLTGSPFENHPKELWPLIHALQPERFRDFMGFARRYCDARRKKVSRDREVWDFNGATHSEELGKLLRTYVMIRRLKPEVLPELPRKRRQVIELPAELCDPDDRLGLFLQPDERLAGLREALARAAVGGDTHAYRQAIAALKRGGSAPFASLSRERLALAEAKLPSAIAHLHSLIDAGEKVLCFAHHRLVIDAVQKEFGEKCVTIQGAQAAGPRQHAIDRFQDDPSIRMAAVSLLAGGTGLNLTAASIVVFLELDFRPMKMIQAEDRACRIGQTKSILVQILVAEGSLDPHIAAELMAKLEVIERSLNTRVEPGPMTAPDPIPAPPPTAVMTAPLNPWAAAAVARSEAIHRAIKFLAGRCDHARSHDGSGFDQMDAKVGHGLAAAKRLTPEETRIALRLVRRYRRQVPASLMAEIDPPERKPRDGADQMSLGLDPAAERQVA